MALFCHCEPHEGYVPSRDGPRQPSHGSRRSRAAAATVRRELAEETGVIRNDLRYVGHFDVPCDVHEQDEIELFVVHPELSDSDIVCNGGRQTVFVQPESIVDLQLTGATRALYERVLAEDPRTPAPVE